MKKIQTNNYQKRQADLIEHPPVDGEGEASRVKGKKVLKYFPQLGKSMWVLEDE